MIRPRLLIFSFILPVTQLIRDSLEDSQRETTPLVGIESSGTKLMEEIVHRFSQLQPDSWDSRSDETREA